MSDQARQFYATLPKKRMAAGALFFNEHGDLLIVKPTYRDGWLIPGGAIEEYESPRNGCIREVQEEIGFTGAIGRLLSIDYVSDNGERTESLQFTFYGGRLNTMQIEALHIPANELSAYQFATRDVAQHLLNQRLARRVQQSIAALEGNAMLYLEDGEVVE